MINDNEVLQKITEDINDQASIVVEVIYYEADSLEQDQIRVFKEGLSKEIETYKEKELSELTLLAATQASQNKLKTKRDLLAIRQGLVDELVVQVSEKLKDFVASNEYGKFLEKKVDLLSLNDDEGYFEIREEDVVLLKSILKKKSLNTEIRVSNLRIGGFRYTNLSKGYEVDHTLETSLKNQIQWFRNHSGFTI